MGNARHAGPHVPALAELGVPDAEIASVQVPYAAFNVVGESWTYFYGLGVVLEVILLALILRYAWTWPRTAPWRPARTVRPRPRSWCMRSTPRDLG